MTAVEHYAGLTLPTPYRVLGQVLEPFCLGHALLLEKFCLSEITTAEELMLAVSICCERPSEFGNRLQRFSSRIRWAVWGCRCRRLLRDPRELLSRITLFGHYLKDGIATPDYEPASNSDNANTRIPFYQWLRVVLIGKLHYSPAEILDVPYRQAIWDYWTFLEQEGLLKILDGETGDKARAMSAQAEKLQADLMARFHANGRDS